MKQDVWAQLEGIGAPIARDAPGFGEITNHLRIICRVKFQQRGVVGYRGMDKYKRKVGVAVVIRRLGVDRELKDPAPAWARFGESSGMEGKQSSDVGKNRMPMWAAGPRRPAHRDLVLGHRRFLRKGAAYHWDVPDCQC